MQARHGELDECKEALVREAASIVEQAHRLQAQQGDPRDPWMLRMVLVEACRGTAHEGEIEKVDLDTATMWETAHWIASHWRMTD
eukprot:4655931-Lingulodinium_polyedra.AAC.1